MSKKILLAAVAFFLSLGMLFAQAPNKFNYQGIARNTAGQALANQSLGLQLTIRTGSATGATQFQETHTVTTNAYGLYKVEVGTGTNVSGSISAVTWATGSKYMQVEIDPTGGTSYTSLGNTELLSVPYSLYAASGNQGPAGANGTNGTNGTNGLDGKTVLSGNGAPANSLGNNGDFYIRTSNNRIYGPKTGGAWGSSISLVGPQGPAGANGTNGTNGTQGIQGIPGTPGATGPSGSANINGTTNNLIKFTGATTGGNSMITDDGTTVRVDTGSLPTWMGNLSALNKLEIYNNANTNAVAIVQNSLLNRTALQVSSNNHTGIEARGGYNGIKGSGDFNGVLGISTRSDNFAAGVSGINSSTGPSVMGQKSSTQGYAGYFHSSYNAGVISDGIVKIQHLNGTANYDHIGLNVFVKPNPAGNYGVGIKAEGGWRGVFGESTHTGTNSNVGVYGFGRNSGGTSYGLFGISFNNTGSTTGSKYGVYGTASGGSSNYAGYFGGGNVQVSNMLSKGGGTFKIDHPLDPENKYLYHSFVESPDMMNIYNGNITTDAQGFATVTMPNYFNALNTDFCYQLTVMGTFAQAIVKEEIANGEFKIQTNTPNVKVSWQVTGVRNDKFAQANRVQVEVEKPEDEKGLYLHSEAWGQSKDKDMNYIIHQKPMEDKEAAAKK